MPGKAYSSIEQSNHFQEILDIYQNRGEKSVQKVFEEVQKIDRNISRPSFYRWVNKMKKTTTQLSNLMSHDLAIDEVKSNIEKKRLLNTLIALGADTLADPKELLKLSPKDKLTLALNASRELHAEEGLMLNDLHHREKIDLTKEIQDAAARPQIIIEDNRTGEI